MAASSSKRKVEHECPQCGAPVELQESDRLLSCGYCRVSLILLTEDFFRYYIPPANPRLEDVIYVPYWRFKGMHYSVDDKKINDKILDLTFLASPYRQMPLSLGVRTQVVPMRFITGKQKAFFFMPHQPFDELFRKYDAGRRSVENLDLRDTKARPSRHVRHIHHEAFIGETMSLIYLPTFLHDDQLYDGVTNEPAAPFPDPEDGLDSLHARQDWKINFMPSVCPGCGWDLSGEKDSALFFCTNCDKAWEAGGSGLHERPFGVIPTTARNPLYLPFWELRAEVEGMVLDTYADFIRAARIPKAVMPKMEDIKFDFWAPAFKLPPAIYLRVARQMTIAQPEQKYQQSVKRMKVHPVGLPRREAFESLKSVLGSIVMNKRDFLPTLGDIELTPGLSRLVYVPFEETPHEFTHRAYQVSITKGALKYGRDI